MWSRWWDARMSSPRGKHWFREFFLQDGKLISDYRLCEEHLQGRGRPGVHLIFVCLKDKQTPQDFSSLRGARTPVSRAMPDSGPASADRYSSHAHRPSVGVLIRFSNSAETPPEDSPDTAQANTLAGCDSRRGFRQPGSLRQLISEAAGGTVVRWPHATSIRRC